MLLVAANHFLGLRARPFFLLRGLSSAARCAFAAVTPGGVAIDRQMASGTK